jgi:hypothetical protein
MEHLARVGEQAHAVAVVNRPEGVIGAGAEQRHELFVGAQSQERSGERGPAAVQAFW